MLTLARIVPYAELVLMFVRRSPYVLKLKDYHLSAKMRLCRNWRLR